MNDTTRRFLTGVLERVPESRIVEVRLFPAIRQGGVESAVAVLAVEAGFDDVPISAADATAAVELEEETSESTDTANMESEASDHEVERHTVDADDSSADVVEVAGRADPMQGLAVEVDRPAMVGGELERVLEVASEGMPMADAPPHVLADVTAAEDEGLVTGAAELADVPRVEDVESIMLGDILLLPPPEATMPVRDPDERLAILCARYRLVVKGPDRGKWTLEVVHQADAPLATLERVITGVVRRAGEASEPERFTTRSLRERLDAPPWVEGAAA